MLEGKESSDGREYVVVNKVSYSLVRLKTARDR